MTDGQPSFAVLGQATAKNTQGEAIVTGAKLIGGLATDQTKYRKNQTVKLSDPVTVAGLIAAETGHINQPAEIVVYAAYTPLSAPDSPPLYFMLDSHSGIQLWDENVNTLVAFQSVAALEDVAEIKMYQDPFPAAGFLKIYFGYRSPDGTVVVNGEPIEVKVTE